MPKTKSRYARLNWKHIVFAQDFDESEKQIIKSNFEFGAIKTEFIGYPDEYPRYLIKLSKGARIIATKMKYKDSDCLVILGSTAQNHKINDHPATKKGFVKNFLSNAIFEKVKVSSNSCELQDGRIIIYSKEQDAVLQENAKFQQCGLYNNIRVVEVSGLPGTGKTNIAYQILQDEALAGRGAYYVTLSDMLVDQAKDNLLAKDSTLSHIHCLTYEQLIAPYLFKYFDEYAEKKSQEIGRYVREEGGIANLKSKIFKIFREGLDETKENPELRVILDDYLKRTLSGKEEFIIWYNQKKPNPIRDTFKKYIRSEKLRINPDDIYTELKKVGMQVGKKGTKYETLHKDQEGNSTIVLLLDAYIAHLVGSKSIDTAFVAEQFKSTGDVSAAADNSDSMPKMEIATLTLDETQNFSYLQLKAIFEMLSPGSSLYLCGDGNQCQEDPFNLVSKSVRQLMKGSDIQGEHFLCTSFRNPPAITEFTRTIIKMKGQIVGGQPNKGDEKLGNDTINSLEVSDNSGHIEIINKGEDDKISKLQSMDPLRSLIVTLNEKDKNDAKSLFPGILVYTSTEAAGLEFDNVIIYNPFGKNSLLSHGDLFKVRYAAYDPDKSSFPKNSDFIEYAAPFNQLLTAATRSKQKLYILNINPDTRRQGDKFFMQNLGVILEKYGMKEAIEHDNRSSYEALADLNSNMRAFQKDDLEIFIKRLHEKYNPQISEENEDRDLLDEALEFSISLLKIMEECGFEHDNNIFAEIAKYNSTITSKIKQLNSQKCSEESSSSSSDSSPKERPKVRGEPKKPKINDKKNSVAANIATSSKANAESNKPTEKQKVANKYIRKINKDLENPDAMLKILKKISVDYSNPNFDIVFCNQNPKLTLLNFLAEDDRCFNVVKYLVDNGADANIEDMNGVRAITAATKNNCNKNFTYLLNNGVDIDFIDFYGNNLLQVAFKAGAEGNNRKIVYELLKAGKKVKLFWGGQYQRKLILSALEEGDDNYIAIQGENINAIGDKGNTALHIVTSEGNVDKVKKLLSFKNLNTKLKNDDQKTPLQLASGINDDNTKLLIVRAIIEYSKKASIEESLCKLKPELLGKSSEETETSLKKYIDDNSFYEFDAYISILLEEKYVLTPVYRALFSYIYKSFPNNRNDFLKKIIETVGSVSVALPYDMDWFSNLIKKSNYEMFKILIENQNPNSLKEEYDEGNLKLHLDNIIRNKQIDCLKVFLDKEIVPKNQFAMLEKAVLLDDQAAELLIDYNSVTGTSPLYYGVFKTAYNEKKYHLVKKLIRLVSWNDNLEKFLIKYYIDSLSANDEEMVQVFEYESVNISEKYNHDVFYAIREASDNNNVEAIGRILSKASLKYENKEKLFFCLQAYLDKPKTLEILIKNLQFDLNYVYEGFSNNSLLNSAIILEKHEAVIMLIKAGANKELITPKARNMLENYEAKFEYLSMGEDVLAEQNHEDTELLAADSNAYDTP